MKKRTLKIISIALAAALLCGTCIFAFAATVTVSVLNLPRPGESKTGWEYPAMNMLNGWVFLGSDHMLAYSADGYYGKAAYCFEPGAPLDNGDARSNQALPDTLGDNFFNNYPSNLNDALTPRQIHLFLGRILKHGYTGNINFDWSTSNSTHANQMAQYIATQRLIWEVIVGERDAGFNKIDANLRGRNNIMESVASNHPLRSQILSAYNSIVSSVKGHTVIPSFMRSAAGSAVSYSLDWDGAKYMASLNDTNGVLSDYNFTSSDPAVTCTVQGNNLVLSAAAAPSGEVTVTANKKNATRKSLLIWHDNVQSNAVSDNDQDIVTYGEEIDDPVQGFVKLGVSAGSLAIIKSVEGGGSVAGFSFEVSGAGTFTTGASGRIDIPNLAPGSYTVREVNLSGDFVQPSSQTVEVRAGQTATVTFNNVKKQGVITVRKTNSDSSMGNHSLAGAVFEVRDSGGTVVDTVTAGADGTAKSKPLPLGSYRVTEKTAPDGFVRNTNEYTVSLSGAQGSEAVVYAPELSIANKPQTGKITVTKQDTVTGGTAQGDATLAGAVFEILAEDQTTVVDTLYCGSDVKATSKELPLGTYFIREKSVPIGYTLNENLQRAVIDYAGQDMEVTQKNAEVKNKVIEAQIAVTKHVDQPDESVSPSNPQIEQPLEGAIFEVYLKAAGSYDGAKESERDILTTNEHGYAITKKLPYGLYTVRETFASGDVKLVEPFDVFISAEGKIYRYILNDIAFTSLVKIIKTDAETGKTIPAAGTSFRVKNARNGEWVVHHINYPAPMDIEVFETAADGTLVMPEPLRSGEYELHEVHAPRGYLLSETPVPFSIGSAQGDPMIVEVVMANSPQKGVIKLEKKGNMLTGASAGETSFGKQYTPVFSLAGLTGAVFDIVAAEDIITPDGTLRCARGTVADTITTGADGGAETKPLYLGRYTVTETKAPPDFVLDTTPHDAYIMYAGQEAAVTSTQLGLGNARQKVKIELQKQMERPDNMPEDLSIYRDVVFGLFAGDHIKAADGSVVIAKNALVALIQLDKSGKGTVYGELPFAQYYIRELKTKPGYILDETMYLVIAEYSAAAGPEVKIAVDSGEPVVNELQHGDLKIIKTFEEKTVPLSGVPFTVEGVSLAGIPYSETFRTDDEGVIFIKGLPVGQYTVTELDVELTTGYWLSATQTAVVAANRLTVLEIGNRLQRGNLKIVKVFEGKKEPAANVPFLIEGKSATGLTFSETLYTNTNGFILAEGLPVGSYTVRELESEMNKGYLLSEEQTVAVTADETTEIVVENKLITGTVKVRKVDAATGKPLKGAVFELRRIDGKLIAGVESGKDGYIRFLNIPYGDYELVEIKAAPGYMKTDKVYLVTIRKQNASVEFEIPNEKIPVEIPPETGDNAHMWLWVGLAVISAAALAGIPLYGKFRRKRGKRDVRNA